MRRIRHLLHRAQWLIIAFAYACIVVCFVAGSILFINPLVEYHGHWFWQSEVNAHYHPLYCAQYPGTALYRDFARYAPVISFYACFDSNLAALTWMREHPAARP